MKKIHPFIISCLLLIHTMAAAQDKATYFLGGGAVTAVSEKGLPATGPSWAVNGIAVTAETGLQLRKNSIGLQYLLRLHDDLELIRDYSIVYGRQLVAEKRFSMSLHAGIGLERYAIRGEYDNDPEYAVVPLYADLRFGLSKNPAANTSVWIGLRGGRYLSAFRPFTIGQVNLVIVAPWR